eukprot:CFRG6412T1
MQPLINNENCENIADAVEQLRREFGCKICTAYSSSCPSSTNINSTTSAKNDGTTVAGVANGGNMLSDDTEFDLDVITKAIEPLIHNGVSLRKDQYSLACGGSEGSREEKAGSLIDSQVHSSTSTLAINESVEMMESASTDIQHYSKLNLCLASTESVEIPKERRAVCAEKEYMMSRRVSFNSIMTMGHTYSKKEGRRKMWRRKTLSKKVVKQLETLNQELFADGSIYGDTDCYDSDMFKPDWVYRSGTNSTVAREAKSVRK